MLPSLRCKPGAFARWVLCDAMFQRPEYALDWAHLSKRQACRLIVDLLDLANRANVVAKLALVLPDHRERDEVPDIKALRSRFAPRLIQGPIVTVVLAVTAVCDELLVGT